MASFSEHIFILNLSVKKVQYTYQSLFTVSIAFNSMLENQESMGNFSRDTRELSNLQHIQTLSCAQTASYLVCNGNAFLGVNTACALR
jgi:hypothetical protein